MLREGHFLISVITVVVVVAAAAVVVVVRTIVITKTYLGPRGSQ
jgi:hypothetical protein